MWCCGSRKNATHKSMKASIQDETPSEQKADDILARAEQGLATRTKVSFTNGTRPALSDQTRSDSAWSQRRLTPFLPLAPVNSNASPSTLLSPSPLPRRGHALPATMTPRGELFLFGGLAHGTAQNDLYFLSMRDCSASLMTTTGSVPSPRFGHASALIGSVFLVWGGDTRTHREADSGDVLDDGLYLFSTKSREWTRIAVDGLGPTGRYGHSVTVAGSKIYVFGGQADGELFDDLWSFDLSTLREAAKWELVKPAEASPRPARRTGHVCVTHEEKLVIFGGTDGQSFYNDTWVFDFATSRWLELACAGPLPTPRAGHAGAVVNNVLYVFGGRGSSAVLPGVGVLKLNAWKLRWSVLQDAGPEPCVRAGHAMATCGTRIVVIGGEGEDITRDPDVVYALDTEKIRYV
ncbi:hypothetical protein B0H21DRAFT_254574 [Amylocystis lapponica]|nr:hypothetical protein B0H21DRAFT_254574 [Amylocystis lapponica]